MCSLPNWPIFLTVPEHLRKHTTGVFVCNSNEMLLVTDKDADEKKNEDGKGADIYHAKGGNFNKVLTLDNDKVADIAVVSGEPVFLLLTQNENNLYAWGWNSCGTVGNGQKVNNHVETPFLVSSEGSHIKNETVIQIAAGQCHSVCLTAKGRVYAWGDNSNCQVGVANAFSPTPMLHDTIKNRKIVRIACCSYTTLALDSEGQLFGWGYSVDCNRVLGTATPSSVPIRIAGDSIFQDVKIKDIACGPCFVLAVTPSGIVYSWGNNANGQLGLGTTTHAAEPTRLTTFDSPSRVRIDSILANNTRNTSLAKSVSGDLYVWGQTRNGSTNSPVKVPGDNLQVAFCELAPQALITPSYTKVEKMQLIGQKTQSPLWLHKSFDNASTSDLKIVVEGRPIHVHKSLLTARSEYFHTMLNDERWRENKSGSLEIDNYSYTIYRTLLYYMYTNDPNLPDELSQEEAVSLYHLANSCFEEELKGQVCLFILKKWFNLDSVLSLYGLACDNEMTDIADACMELILENLTKLTNSAGFNELKPEYAKKIMKMSGLRNLFKS